VNLVGFQFPFCIVDGSVAQAAEHEKIRQNVRHLLSVRSGERLMRRDYGGGVHQRVHHANDETLRSLVRHEIEHALRVYLPNARLTSPLHLDADEHTLTVTIEYRANPADVVRRLQLELLRGGA
jgi:phage baseplate assembly protein W